MRFDFEDVFIAAGPESMLSLFASGLVIGYLFAGRMSAHLTVAAYAFRTAVIGLVFLLGMMLTRGLAGADRWEAWIGISSVFLVYTVGLTIGISVYDRQFKKSIEAHLGRPIRGNPRGIVRIDKRDEP